MIAPYARGGDVKIADTALIEQSGRCERRRAQAIS
jgi:hypothetical protein